MKTNQMKVLMTSLFVVMIVLSSCTQPQEGVLEYNPVDLSKHKLSPDKAENLSKRYIKDMEILFAQSDSLQYYKALSAKLKAALDNKTNLKEIPDFQKTLAMSPAKPKFELSVSDWYSVDELLTYIGRSIATVKMNGGEVDGFRVYIGVFPSKGEGEKDNTLTTFITPTGTMGNGKQNGNMMPLSYPLYAVSSDLTGVDPMNYGSDGNPPDAAYPQ